MIRRPGLDISNLFPALRTWDWKHPSDKCFKLLFWHLDPFLYLNKPVQAALYWGSICDDGRHPSLWGQGNRQLNYRLTISPSNLYDCTSIFSPLVAVPRSLTSVTLTVVKNRISTTPAPEDSQGVHREHIRINVSDLQCDQIGCSECCRADLWNQNPSWISDWCS